MRVRTEAQANSAVPSLASIVTDMQKQLGGLKEGWLQQLCKDPSRFGQVEVEVHHAFQHLADQVVAGLLGEAGRQPPLEEACKKSR